MNGTITRRPVVAYPAHVQLPRLSSAISPLQCYQNATFLITRGSQLQISGDYLHGLCQISKPTRKLRCNNPRRSGTLEMIFDALRAHYVVTG